MKAVHVNLRPEITREDAYLVMQWMSDHEVSRFLNEKQNVTSAMERTLERVELPILTHLFNHNGSFFIVCTEHDGPAGFLRLIRRAGETEMVVVIGNRRLWGQGIGFHAIGHGLRHAFFDWRSERVVAKIHAYNTRSHRVFQKAGFCFTDQVRETCHYEITMDRFLRTA